MRIARKRKAEEIEPATDPLPKSKAKSRKVARKAAAAEAAVPKETVAKVKSEAAQLPKVGKKARKAVKDTACAAAATVEQAPVHQETAGLTEAEAKARKAAKLAAKKKRKKENKREKKAAAAPAAVEQRPLHKETASLTKIPEENASTTRVKTTAEEESRLATCNRASLALDSLTVFVGGFPFETTEAKLRQDFEECGLIEKFVVPKDAEGKRRGIAYITFKTKDGVDAACKFDGDDYGGRVLMVNKVGPIKKGKGDKGKGKAAKGEGSGKGSNDHEVSVRGLPFSTAPEHLKKHFAACGEVAGFKLLYNEEGTVRGSAFVAFNTEESFRKALELNETEYGGRTIYVSKAGSFGGKGKNGKSKGKGKGLDKGHGKSKKRQT